MGVSDFLFSSFDLVGSSEQDNFLVDVLIVLNYISTRKIERTDERH